MEEQMNTLFVRSSVEFEEMISDVQLLLYQSNKRYKKISDKIKKLKHSNSKVFEIFENENPKFLNKKDINALITILNNEVELKYMELKEMFMLGNKEAYYYFKRIGILKD